ncbi:MAG: hypothetical protein R8M71_01045 [Alphaproteobacteria bacterium]|nr:hypothetical protein [Alphaproteobacteria bacterium]
MKKLTAGIFATILGLTAIDAYAAIPTQNYVDEAMGAAVTSANSYTDTKVGEIVVPDVSSFATTTYVNTQDAATLDSAKSYADQAEADAVATAKAYTDQAELDANAYTDTKVGNLGTSTDVVSYVGAQGYLKAADVSGKAEKTYVDDQDAATLSEAKTYADQAEADAVATAKAYTDQAELDAVATAKGYADETFMTKTDHETFATKIAVIEAEQDTQDEAIAKKQNAFTGTCPAGATCYVDATGVIQVAVDKYTPAN